MDVENFISKFITYLKKNDKKCIELLENNEKFVNSNFVYNTDTKIINKFVEELNDAILNAKQKYKLFEIVLKNPSLKKIYSAFKKSNILIQACKFGNVKAIKWLITMNINPYVQDKEGMSALMYAVQNLDLLFVVTKYQNDFKCCNLEDENGNNILFYSIHNITAILQLSEVDINHLNHDHETVLLYCCKNKIYDPLKFILGYSGIDFNITDSKGKTALMYLVENGRENEIGYFSLLQSGNSFNFNYINDHGESALSTIIKRMYCKDGHVNGKGTYKQMIKILVCFIKAEVDFNIVVDEDGNTALMAFLIARDFDTFNFVVLTSKNLDFSKKNKFGENVTSLILKIGGDYFPKKTRVSTTTII
ncbi:hypothetical protein BCR36DRAFT_584907 [Piromyces finnis]|uniref:Uncharacterized protein n=1 Tax=Piromyces finnis TaxID=1754191 RepID=A0A1Y1V6C9_9FUNG|nr:hypothetical protein BCR36DRAFT_584907 [Piromyces finnis]|eukprot:ORX47094.1 hypothetical protein BCR36DRAFT_584907 [Piromyces finnis]